MKKFILPLIVLLIISGVAAIIGVNDMSDKKAANVAETAQEAIPEEVPSSPQKVAGRYSEYSAEKVTESGYESTVLFFYAAWCPECRAFKQAITTGSIPAGVQVLEVNYDKASDLKKSNSVTLQSTFVKVDNSGKQISKWVGYGKEKSLQTVLANL